ncbi:hypothetical protein ACSBR2_016323 [Camellia fascicularis]
MSTTQLSEFFNALLKDYIHYDFNLNEFFMHFEKVLCEKRYKELETRYALCQRLPRVRAPFRMLSEMGNVYTKIIFEEFQDEYFLSVESDIQAIEYDESCTLYTIVDTIGKNVRKVKMEMDGSLACIAALDANVESKLRAHFCTEKEVSIDDQPQSLEVAYEDNNHVMQIPTRMKKKHPTSKGKRRIKRSV